jgi:hypothetical protein
VLQYNEQMRDRESERTYQRGRDQRQDSRDQEQDKRQRALDELNRAIAMQRIGAEGGRVEQPVPVPSIGTGGLPSGVQMAPTQRLPVLTDELDKINFDPSRSEDAVRWREDRAADLAKVRAQTTADEQEYRENVAALINRGVPRAQALVLARDRVGTRQRLAPDDVPTTRTTVDPAKETIRDFYNNTMRQFQSPGESEYGKPARAAMSPVDAARAARSAAAALFGEDEVTRVLGAVLPATRTQAGASGSPGRPVGPLIGMSTADREEMQREVAEVQAAFKAAPQTPEARRQYEEILRSIAIFYGLADR